jgi:hypothetical protein
MLVALAFTTGCFGGGYPEPATADDYAAADEPYQEQPAEAAYQPVVAEDGAAVANAEYLDTDPGALTEFQAELAPHGAWVNDPTYGMVWVPNREVVGADFAPYVTGGHWALTEDGDWIWQSDYPFGWVTFHYGRWVYIPGSGWAWIAGRRYAHAWVVWRTPYDGYDYVGWAPMPPYYYWSGGVAVSFWVLPPTPWVFCHSHYVFSSHWHSHMARGHHVAEAARRTRPHEPANPSAGSGRGNSGGHRFANPTRGPSLDSARVPASAAPRARVQPNQRALAASRPSQVSPSAAYGGARPQPLGRAAPSSGAAAVSRPVYRGAPSHSAPAYAGNRAMPQRLPGGASSYRASPGTAARPGSSYGAGRPTPYYGPSSSPSNASRPSALPSHRAPSYSSPSFGSSYGGSRPSAGPSPSYHAPSHSSPSSARPGSSVAPSYRPNTSSAPSGGGRATGRSGGSSGGRMGGGSVGRGGRR